MVSHEGPLSGIRVLDFGRYVAGPYCATLFADFGADVIRIERPGGGEDREVAPIAAGGDGALFLQINRNKRSLTLNLRAKGAERVVRRLVERADVVVVNVPDSALPKMGLDYATLSAINPRIVLVNISSFGPTGPWSDRPGFDSVGQAMCGSAFLSGEGDVPYRTPITWVDHATALYAAFGVMVALHERERTGLGQQVGGNLLGSAVAFSATYLVEQAMLGLDRQPAGNRGTLNGPTDTFRTRDGWIVTQVVGPVIFRRWAELVGEPKLVDDPRFATDASRGENGTLLSARMQLWCAQRTSEEALGELARASIPAGPVLDLGQVLEHPQARAMGLFVPTKVPGLDREVPLIRTPVELSHSPSAIRNAAPGAGEHSEAILGELGFNNDAIAEFRAVGAI